MAEQEKITWTPEQYSAIFSRGEDLAVSAAAGSGKTKVLVQRIVEMIAKDGMDASRIAVVTYTKNAAEELEERLYAALAEKSGEETENAHLRKQLFSLSRAQISTIHSFALTLIKEHRKELGLGEKIRVGDAAECAILEESAVREAMNLFLSAETEEEKEKRESLFFLLGDTRSFKGVSLSVRRLLSSAATCPGGIDYFREKVDQLREHAEKMNRGEADFFETDFGKVIRREAVDRLQEGAGMLLSMAASLENTQFLSERYVPFFQEGAAILLEAARMAEQNDLFGARAQAERLFEKDLANTRGIPEDEVDLKEAYSGLYNKKIKTPLRKHMASLASLTAPQLKKEVSETVEIAALLFDLAELAQENFSRAKREKGIVDYSDLEQMALSLVAKKEDGIWRKTPLAEKIGEGFDALFVDEYQDTNKTQDLIFRMIAKEGTLFLVGDPKQSIYQFRGAEPSIFSEYKTCLPFLGEEKEGMKKILLSDNFRCDDAVIRTVNQIFAVMMDDSLPTSLYTDDDKLKFSKQCKPWENLFPAEMIFVAEHEEEEAEEAEEESEEDEGAFTEKEDPEAAYIAQRIVEILKGEITGPDGKPFEPSDIAVLCRYGTHLSHIRKALVRYGIPYQTADGEPLREEPEYLFITSLLSVLDNPTKDVPLLGALSSPVFRFSPDALYRIRKNASDVSFYSALKEYAKNGSHGETAAMCAETLNVFEELRCEAKRLPLTAFLFSLYRRFSPDLLFPTQGERGAVRSWFLANAKSAESADVATVGEFCRFLEQADTKGLPGGSGGVKLMSIHKSKGLEFPIVFVSWLTGKYNTQDEYPALLISRSLGIATSLPKLEGTARLDTLMRKAVKLQMRREMIDEEKRILYVALTRARNKLILTAKKKKLDSLKASLMLENKGELDRALVRSRMDTAGCPLDLLIYPMRTMAPFRTALETDRDAADAFFSVRFATPAPEAYQPEEKGVKLPPCDPQKVLEDLDFQYADSSLETLPQKLSVSQILKREKDESARELYPHRLLDFEKGSLKSGAEKIGTATHQVMQFCDFEKMEEDPEEEFARLVDKGFLSSEDMALVEKEKVLGFFSSALYQKMKASPGSVREKRFNVLLDAGEMGVGKGEVLIQGVVDAWFENPDGTLTILDFKTDRVKDPEGEKILRERHGQQLRLYATAVEKMTGKTVSALYLYSFALGREVSVDLLSL